MKSNKPVSYCKFNVMQRELDAFLRLCLFLVLASMQFFLNSVQGQSDTLPKKENFLLSLFPEDCMSIYNLSLNPFLKTKLDTIKNKFSVYSISLRKKPGLANFVFEKLSESLLPDSLKYILLKINFNYEGRNLSYSITTEAKMNCDTLKSTFTLPLVQKVEEKVLAPLLASKTFNQPIGDKAVDNFNSAIFPTIDTLLFMFNNDRVQSLSVEIEKCLHELEDSLTRKSKWLKSRFSDVRETLRNLISSEEIDSSLYFGSRGQYSNEGMSSFFQFEEDSLSVAEFNEIDTHLDSLLKLDIKLLQINFLATNIRYLKKEGLLPFSHRIMMDIENEHIEVDDFLLKSKGIMLYAFIRKYYEKFTIEQLKQIL